MGVFDWWGRIWRRREESSPSPSQENEPLVELRHVSLTLGRKPVLEDVSLSVARREALAIVGPSGSGKSTILRLMAGLIAPDVGEVILRSQSLGMSFQSSALMTSLSVFDNVALPLRKTRRAMSEAEIEGHVLDKLTLVGMADAAGEMPNALSGGMQKRVSIARALVVEPDIILYDEPSAGLDPMTAAKLEADMRQISRRIGAASVIVTHDLDTIAHVADRVVMLYQSGIVWQGDRETFLTADDPYPRQFRERSPEGPIQV